MRGKSVIWLKNNSFKPFLPFYPDPQCIHRCCAVRPRYGYNGPINAGTGSPSAVGISAPCDIISIIVFNGPAVFKNKIPQRVEDFYSCRNVHGGVGAPREYRNEGALSARAVLSVDITARSKRIFIDKRVSPIANPRRNRERRFSVLLVRLVGAAGIAHAVLRIDP